MALRANTRMNANEKANQRESKRWEVKKMSLVQGRIVESQVQGVLNDKRQADLLAGLRAANICGCGNCRRAALRTKEFYDGPEAANKYEQPADSPFRTRR